MRYLIGLLSWSDFVCEVNESALFLIIHREAVCHKAVFGVRTFFVCFVQHDGEMHILPS